MLGLIDNHCVERWCIALGFYKLKREMYLAKYKDYDIFAMKCYAIFFYLSNKRNDYI